MNELGALLRDVRRQSGDPVEVVILAVAVRYCIVPVVGDGSFGEVSELRFGAGVGLKAGRRTFGNAKTTCRCGTGRITSSRTNSAQSVARLDRRKRPELFLDLAAKFPHVRFVAAGISRDPGWEASLRKRYGGFPNLDMPGFVDQFRSGLHTEILGKSWIMVNTAAREGLPNSFLEAAAHRCAILSGVDPDGFASRFGYHAAADDFTEGLARLLEGNRWRERSEKGHEYVRETFEIGRAIDLHLAAYGRALGDRGVPRPRGT